jgi:hypothetical protein
MRTQTYCDGGVWLMCAALGLFFSGGVVSFASDAEASRSGSERDTAERYLGDYEFSSGYLVSVRGNTNGLLFRGAGQPSTALLPTSAIQILPVGKGSAFSQEAEFAVKGAKAHVRFASDDDGEVTSLQYVGGWNRCTADFKARKLSGSEARASYSSIDTRVASAVPLQGSEAALVKFIGSVVSGRPEYDGMDRDLAAAVRCQLSPLEFHLRYLGAVVSRRFIEIDKVGWDVYELRHRRGRKTRWHVNLTADGRLIGVIFVDLSSSRASPCKSGSGCMQDFWALNPH